MNFNPLQYRKDLATSVNGLRRSFGSAPDLAIVFGSGLGKAFLAAFPRREPQPFSSIPHFPEPQIEGHVGALFKLSSPGPSGLSALVLQGRVHYYEGLPPEKLVFPIRALALWGVKRLILTNASGSLNEKMRAGDLVLLRDHINLTGVNPLRGPNLDFLGPRFPSLEHAYQNSFSQQVLKLAHRVKVKLSRGVYVGVAGPSYETDAEIRAFGRIGGDVIGMSTVLETIAAAHAGMEVVGLAAVTNNCSKRKEPLDHHQVLETAKQIDLKLAKILLALMSGMEMKK